MAAHSTARQRVQIIPLPEPTGPVVLSMPPAVQPIAAQPITVPAPEASVPRLAPAVSTGGDRRKRRPGRTPEGDAIGRLTCSSCGVDARIDVVDLHTHRLHLSCDSCYRMWQDQVRHDDAAPSTRRTSGR
jgi:hypothetical protein